MRLYYNTNIGLFSNTKVLQFLGIRKHHVRWDTDAIQLQADHQPQNMGNQDGTGNEQEYRSIGNKPDAGQNPDEDKHPLSGDYGQGQLRHGGKGAECFLGTGAPMPHVDESL